MAEPDAIRQAAKGVSAAMKRARRPPQVQIPWLDVDPAFDEGINLWMDNAGKIRGYRPDGTKIQYSTETVTAPSGSAPADPEPEQFIQTYDAAWARTFCDLHGVETGGGLWYGDDPSGAHLGRKIMIGLPDATIRADTLGADIDLVELKMINTDAYQVPVTIHFGVHAQTSPPATYSAVRKDAALLTFPSNDFRVIHSAFGRWLRDDVARGITIDQPAGFVNAGQIDWASTQIRISYTV